MNDEQYQQKLQYYYSKAGLQSSLAPAIEPVTHTSNEFPHELQVHKIEMKKQNEELLAAKYRSGLFN